jgi:hypothetical protein
MFKNFTRHLVALFASLGIALPAAASTFSTDYTDLWGTQSPNESGWGLNLIQQGDVIFATMFVYGADNSDRWFVASDLSSSNGTTWTATLYQTRGPYFGAASFDPNSVTRINVGTMTLNFTGPNSGVLQYSANGVNVTKNISRFSLRGNNLSGNYLGGMTAKCSNGDDISIFHALTVSQSSAQIGASVSLVVDFFNFSGIQSQCRFNGSYGITGRLNSVSGTYNCTYGTTPGNNGSFTISRIEASRTGFSGVLTASDNFCTGGMTGWFGGVKDALYSLPP